MSDEPKHGIRDDRTAASPKHGTGSDRTAASKQGTGSDRTGAPQHGLRDDRTAASKYGLRGDRTAASVGDPWRRLPSMAPATPGPYRPGARTVAPSPLDPGASSDPHGIHRTLREEFPLTYDPLLRAWVLSRYADVATALTDGRFTHGHRPGDPPCARAHVDVDVEALRSVAERTAYVLARRVAERPQADLVADFCHWLPAGTVAAAVGVPYRDMMRLVRGRAAGALAGECGAQIAVREKALASFLANVLVDPGQVAALRDAPAGLVGRAWTESLRRDPPVQVAMRRTGAEVPVSGGVVPAGASVALLVGSAGRDPERFREPERFDPLRDDPGQLTYGSGFCPAVVLAGLEAEYALRALFAVMPRLRLADGFRPIPTGLITRAPRSLIVRPSG